MNMSEKLVLFSALVTLCFARIEISTSESEKSSLVEAAVQLLELCYGNQTTAVGLAGSSAGMIGKALWSRKSVPVTLIDETATKLKKNSSNLQYKLQVFAMTASSSITLKKTLVEIKTSIWWNHMADFLIILDIDDGCTNAFEIMWTAWEMNILNAKFLCNDRAKGRLIYTFNPYTSHAPAFWQLDKIYRGRNNHPWSSFVRVYEDSERMCNELDYDKTADLGGYEIRVAVIDVVFGDDHPNTDRSCVSLFDEIMCKVILRALNVTLNVKVHHSLNSIGSIDEEGNGYGILGDILHGLSDIGVTERYLTSLTRLSHAYPHLQEALRSLTQYSEYKTQLSKICCVVDIRSRIVLCLVCLITVLFFKYFLRQSVMEAHLSTIRIICISPLPTITRKVAPRIYLGSLLVFALTMQGIYQGKLAALLTMRERLRNVNTMNDLAELGHTIHGLKRYRRYFTGPEFIGGYVEVDTLTCMEYVIDNPKAACVGEESFIVYEAVKYNLHMSNEPLVPMWAALPIRTDWPLEHRLNTVLMTAMEAQGLQYAFDEAMAKTNRLLQIQENCDKDQTARVLTLEQLGFAFAMLGIGLGCATISFIIEVIDKSNRPRYKNWQIVKRRFLHFIARRKKSL